MASLSFSREPTPSFSLQLTGGRIKEQTDLKYVIKIQSESSRYYL